jgi:hypothetical protein
LGAYNPNQPIVSDSAGNFFWRDESGTMELVALRDGVTRWRTPLGRGSRGFLVNTLLLRDDLLITAFGSTLEARRTSDGRVVWTRDLRVDHRPVEISTTARVGSAVVTAAAASATAAWLTATRSDGKRLWRTRIRGPVARMAASGDRLYLLMSVSGGDDPAIIAVDSTGKQIPHDSFPRHMRESVSGDEVVFAGEQVVTARIGPLPVNCPPQSPSCRPPPFMLTVTGFSAGVERWHFTRPPRDLHVQLLLLSDSSVLLVDNHEVERVSPQGSVTPVCDLPGVEEGHWSLAGLVHGDLVIGNNDGVAAYSLPGEPRLAGAGWVMRGGGPAQDWAARVRP